jgi:hypothetical protein
MQHLEDSGTPVLYIGRTVLKGVLYNYLSFLNARSKDQHAHPWCADRLVALGMR